jgi:hypothetical protein
MSKGDIAAIVPDETGRHRPGAATSGSTGVDPSNVFVTRSVAPVVADCEMGLVPHATVPLAVPDVGVAALKS